jgi:hypothetical protein
MLNWWVMQKKTQSFSCTKHSSRAPHVKFHQFIGESSIRARTNQTNQTNQTNNWQDGQLLIDWSHILNCDMIQLWLHK